jgi:hypothetical protein
VKTDENGAWTTPSTADADEAQRVLALYGLRVVPEIVNGQVRQVTLAEHQADPELVVGDVIGGLAVAYNHAGLATVFNHTQWRGRSGTDGGWKGALQTLPGATLNPKRSFGGYSSRHVMVPLHLAIAPSPTDHEG